MRESSPTARGRGAQVGFVSILIKPFFEEWAQYLGSTECNEQVDINIKKWETEGEEALGDLLPGVKGDAMDPPPEVPAAAPSPKKGR